MDDRFGTHRLLRRSRARSGRLSRCVVAVVEHQHRGRASRAVALSGRPTQAGLICPPRSPAAGPGCPVCHGSPRDRGACLVALGRGEDALWLNATVPLERDVHAAQDRHRDRCRPRRAVRTTAPDRAGRGREHLPDQRPDLYSYFGSMSLQVITILESYQQGAAVWGEAGMQRLSAWPQ